MRIVGISGSLRRESHNSSLLRAVAEVLPSGVGLGIWDGLASIPPYSEDDDRVPAPAPVQRLRDAVDSADALLIATPEYNGSIPGQLKNAIDWASRPRAEASLQNKPAAVIGASTGAFGAVWAQADLRRVLSSAGARVVDQELPVGKAAQAFGEDGRLLDQELARQIERILGELVDLAQIREAIAA